MPSTEPKTITMIDQVDEHVEAIRTHFAVIARVVSDKIVSDAELSELQASQAEALASLTRVVKTGEGFHAAIKIARSLLYTGDITQKVERTWNETLSDLRAMRAIAT